MECDVLIIGAGQAANPLARRLAQAWRLVVLGQRQHLGGSCVNFGCTPTKAAIASAKLAHQARRGEAYGIRIPEVRVDFPAVLARARAIVEEMRGGLERGYAKRDNPRLLHGQARLTGRDGEGFRAEVAGEPVLAGQVVLDTGTRTLMPPIEGLEDIAPLDAGNWLDEDSLPQRLAIVGGGYIGLEMAQFYRRMGSEVTVIQSGDQVAKGEDRDIAEALQALLEREGVAFRMRARLSSVRRRADGLDLTLEDGGLLSASDLFIATGRKPNTDDLGLESVGLETDKKGFIEVDPQLRTSVEDIWAAGDIRGGPMFTHSSWDDYRVLESALLGDGSHTLRRIVPYAIFTDPELGRVGMSETQAREAGKQVKVARFEMASNGKAKELGETDGFIKLVADAKGETLLGAAVLAAQGAELVHLYVDLMNAGAPLAVLERAIHIHPTLAEAAQSALSALR